MLTDIGDDNEFSKIRKNLLKICSIIILAAALFDPLSKASVAGINLRDFITIPTLVFVFLMLLYHFIFFLIVKKPHEMDEGQNLEKINVALSEMKKIRPTLETLDERLLKIRELFQQAKVAACAVVDQARLAKPDIEKLDHLMREWQSIISNELRARLEMTPGMHDPRIHPHFFQAMQAHMRSIVHFYEISNIKSQFFSQLELFDSQGLAVKIHSLNSIESIVSAFSWRQFIKQQLFDIWFVYLVALLGFLSFIFLIVKHYGYLL